MSDSMIIAARIGIPVGAFVLFLAGIAIVALVKKLIASRTAAAAPSAPCAAPVAESDRTVDQTRRAA